LRSQEIPELLAALIPLAVGGSSSIVHGTHPCTMRKHPVFPLNVGQAPARTTIRLGPDTDTLASSTRVDGVHFTTAGCTQVANLWHTAIDPYY
jgi:hypothetical protein